MKVKDFRAVAADSIEEIFAPVSDSEEEAVELGDLSGGEKLIIALKEKEVYAPVDEMEVANVYLHGKGFAIEIKGTPEEKSKALKALAENVGTLVTTKLYLA